jgi:toxin ParE1/3/4
VGQFRLTGPAKEDARQIVSMSRERWGLEASRRYGDLLFAAVLKVADDPFGRMTKDESALSQDLRSLHTRFASVARGRVVRKPVHILYYRELDGGMVQIVRILHERMNVAQYLSEPDV